MKFIYEQTHTRHSKDNARNSEGDVGGFSLSSTGSRAPRTKTTDGSLFDVGSSLSCHRVLVIVREGMEGTRTTGGTAGNVDYICWSTEKRGESRATLDV